MKGILGFLFMLSPAILFALWVWLTWLLWKGGRRFLRSGFAHITVRVVLLVIFAALWLGGAFWEAGGKKMYWDAQVRELCAKDGGVRVYETVELPAEKFNQWGQINFEKPTQGENTLGPEYLVKEETRFLRAENMQPTIFRYQYQVFRRSDGKLLGEMIFYSRRGGDLPGPWHPSSFSCPDSTKGVLANLFIKTNSTEERDKP